MRTFPSWRAWWSPCLLLFLACRESTATSSYATHGYVYGLVTQSSGAPAAAHAIYAKAHLSCAEPVDQAPVAEPVDPATTDARGRYRMTLGAGHSPFTGCVYVHVLSKDAPPRILTSQRGAQLPFTPRGGVYDSVRVDLVIP